MTNTGTALTVDRAVFPSVTGPVTVHSVFASAANLATGGGLFTLVTASRPAGPGTAVLDVASMLELSLEKGRAGELTGDCLRIGDAVIDLAPASRWEPRHIVGPLEPEAVAVLAHRLEGCGLGDGPQPRDLTASSPFQRAVAAQLASRTSAFVAAVAAGSPAYAHDAATRLLGLGSGLTPSGDDWLAGFGYVAAAIPGPLEAALEAIDRAAQPGATVDVALSVIRHALHGRAIDPLQDLLAALTRPPGPDIGAALDRLAEVGHSSGTDMALGLLAAAQLTIHTQGAQ